MTTHTMDWTTLPLEEGGRSLVEASAGTGKTWTITVLYLRLLLERRLSPRQIIVSTFTNMAAAELGERLRSRLLWALAEAKRHAQGECRDEDSPDRRWLHRRWHDGDVRSSDVQWLQAALSEFDAAPISTLHALCARILAEHPFAAGALFRGREMIDGKALQATLQADLWRVISQGDPNETLVRLAQEAQITFADLEHYMPYLIRPDVVVEPFDPFILVQQISDVVGDVSAWVDRVRAVLAQPGLLKANGSLKKAWHGMCDALQAGGQGLADIVVKYRDTLAQVKPWDGVNNAGKNHPELCRLLKESAEITRCLSPILLDRASHVGLRRFLAQAQRWCLQTLQHRLDAANQLTFDQLLTQVYAALERSSEGQRTLADALFAAWPVALVDEFQDTDPVQFGILDAIYTDANGAPRGRLVMIGDPKQAIYRFRGGDIHTYERARNTVPAPARLTLNVNHRSSPAYVAAVNQFYAITGQTLGPPESKTPILYEEVESSERWNRDDVPLLRSAVDDSPVTQPLVLHLHAAEEGGADLEMRALRSCADHIAQALSNRGYRIGERPLQPGDIAVLVPKHAQLQRLARLLRVRGIPCVTGSQQSVFESVAARDLRLVLHAVLHPEEAGAIRAALATRLLGAGADLQAMSGDTPGWDARSRQFHQWHAVLERKGPLALVMALLEQRAAQMLATSEGERLVTDVRHLGELLQDVWEDCGSGERLQAWFADQMRDEQDDGAADTRALRLESDAERVKLMTLHASKGLEFNVVFLPLMWKHTPRRKGSAELLSGNDTAGRPVKYLVMGSAFEDVDREQCEERYRVLYVALTRAKYACHLYALDAAVTTHDQDAPKSVVPEGAPLNELDLSRLQIEASHIRIVSGWDIDDDRGVWERAQPPLAISRQARPLPPVPNGPLWMRHSFSTLTPGHHQQSDQEESPAEDEVLAETFAPVVTDLLADEEHAGTCPELDVLADVAGADFGNAVHDLFEHRRAGQPLTPEAVLKALRVHGVRPHGCSIDMLAQPLARRLQTVLDTPLGEAGVRLADLAAHDMCAELEFHYWLDGVSLSALRKACEAHGATGLVPMRHQTLAGLMTGKIDLVFAHQGRFHVLDYKSNRLSQRLAGYAPAALEQAMDAAGYRFQALLYTVAVERYLRERLGAQYHRATHLGDCWYLFIRAVGLRLPDGTPCGVWHHRFEDGLLDAVQQVFGLNVQEAA